MTINKAAKLCLVTIAALVIFMAWAWFEVYSSSDKLVILTPKDGASGASYNALEKINMEKIMLTYESRSEKTVSYAGANYSAAVKGTNHTYPYVCGFNPGESGFFTETDLEDNRRKAVLNKTAAFNIFGSIDISGLELRIDGEEYIVSGVLYDNDEDNNNIYVPAGLLSLKPEMIIFRIQESAGATKEFALNELKNAGVSENNYNVFDLAGTERFFAGKIKLAFYAALCSLLFVLAALIKDRLVESAVLFRRLLKYEYAKDIIAREKLTHIKVCLYILAAAAVLAVFLYSLLEITNLLMAWDSYKSSMENIPLFFLGKSGYEFQKYDLLTTVALIIAIAAMLFTITRILRIMLIHADKK